MAFFSAGREAAEVEACCCHCLIAMSILEMPFEKENYGSPSMYSAVPSSFCVRSTMKRISHGSAQTHKRKWSTGTTLTRAARCFGEEKVSCCRRLIGRVLE